MVTPPQIWDPGPSFTSEIQSTAFIYFLHFLQVTFIIHTIRLILCHQQAGEIDNLTVTFGQSFLVVLCAGVGSSPTSLITLVSSLRENLLLHSSYLPLGVSQRTWDLHVSNTFSGAVVGDLEAHLEGPPGSADFNSVNNISLPVPHLFSGATSIKLLQGESHTSNLFYFVYCLS